MDIEFNLVLKIGSTDPWKPLDSVCSFYTNARVQVSIKLFPVFGSAHPYLLEIEFSSFYLRLVTCPSPLYQDLQHPVARTSWLN